MAAVRVADIAELIASRQNVYAGAYQADLARLRAAHGDGPVREALALIEQRERAADSWDRAGHRHAVERGLERAVAEHHQHETEAPDAVLPPGWR